MVDDCLLSTTLERGCSKVNGLPLYRVVFLTDDIVPVHVIDDIDTVSDHLMGETFH